MMRLAKPALLLAACLALSACDRGILDPVGPVGQAEKMILINSTAIMLAIVIPTMLATVAFAWWFRRGNKQGDLSSRLGIFGSDRDGRLGRFPR